MSNTTTTLFTTKLTVDAHADLYAAADTKEKARLRSAVATAISAAIGDADLDLAQHLVAVQGTFKSTPKSTAKPVDYAQLVADRIADLEEALATLRGGTVIGLPDEVEVDFDNLPEGTWRSENVRDLATVKARKANRGAVIAWIESVVTDEPAKISVLRSRWVPTSDYPEAAPSAGAIGAAFDRVAAGAEADFEIVEVDGKRGAVQA